MPKGGKMPSDSWAKTRYLDSSAIVKIFIDEGDSLPIRNFYNSNCNFCATSLCVFEALGVLKGKWQHNRISDQQYFEATKKLIIDAWGKKIEIDDVGIINPQVQVEVEKISKKYLLDLSDGLQIVTILKGKYSVLGPNSASILITADTRLASAAEAEGIRVWNCIVNEVPKWA